MPKPKTVPNKLLIGFSDEQLAELDKWRRHQEDLPTRSEVVRRLVDGGLQQMPQRQTWKGYLRLSLVTCPITVIPATSDTEVSFDQINKKTGHRIRYVKVDAATGEEVANEDIVDGYKGETGSYVEVTKDELDDIAPASTRTIDIEEFVPRGEIDPLYIVRPYYIVPDGKVGHDAFAVIRETIRSMKKVALARVTLTNRERIIALDPRDEGMVGTLLRYSYEVRKSARYFDDIQDIKITKDMLDLAKHIVEAKSGHFEPDKFEDYYKSALTKLLAEKQKGLPLATDRNLAAGNVINLMDALKKSLAAEKGK
jgi:DNA end-binding protein Ku